MDSAKHLLLIGLGKPSKGEDKPMEAPESSPVDEAIDEVFSHWKAGRLDKAREAFKSALDVHRMDYESRCESDENEREMGD